MAKRRPTRHELINTGTDSATFVATGRVASRNPTTWAGRSPLTGGATPSSWRRAVMGIKETDGPDVFVAVSTT